ncbi:MAG: hypothetical protein IJC82_04625, partial [Firmicutes bacterium]|nr:hypothetical protein [Bacillota bacterium]
MNMKPFFKKCWKILGHVIAIGLALTLVASCNAQGAETVSMLNLDETAPTGFSETMDNPYGTGYNKAFSIVAQDEILYYDHSGEGAFFDIENNDELKTYFSSGFDNEAYGTAFAMPEGDWLHTKAIAFDGNGGGRDRYVFFAGINVFNEVRVWILDSKENTCSEPIYVCSISWTENLKYHEIYDDVLELTAGDFNGDGKDSVV